MSEGTGMVTGSQIPPLLIVPEFSNNIYNNPGSASNLFGQYEIENSRDMNLTNIEEPAIITIVDNTGDIKYITNKFFLQGITTPKMERFQIVETFKDSKLFFFGERTKIYNIQGQLLEAVNAEDDALLSEPISLDADKAATPDLTKLRQNRDQYRWSTAFQTFYTENLRGTKLAEKGYVANLFFERCTLTGYPIQLQLVHDANVQHLIQFTMTWAILSEAFRDNFTPQLYTPGEPKNSADKANLATLKTDYLLKIKKVKEAEEALIAVQKLTQNQGAAKQLRIKTDELSTAKTTRDAAFKKYKELFITLMKNEG